MHDLAILFEELDCTTKSNEKIAALTRCFEQWKAGDSVWLLYFFLGEKLPRLCTTRELREWVAEFTGHPLWLVEESYAAVGDLAETLSLLACNQEKLNEGETLEPFIEHYLPLVKQDVAQRRSWFFHFCGRASRTELFLALKLMTGGFRVGVSSKNIVKALSRASGLDEAVLMHRLTGKWWEGERPAAQDFVRLCNENSGGEIPSKMYPFFLAYPLEVDPSSLGAPTEWIAEWKWDGIRAQVVRRAGESFLWSRGEELINDQFPELLEALHALPEGTVLDGELLAWRSGSPLSFVQLQRRLGRKRVGKKLLEEVPCILKFYDVLERGGADIRGNSLQERRSVLDELIAVVKDQAPADSAIIQLSPAIEFCDFAQLHDMRDMSRQYGAEGLMLKRLSSPYGQGRRKGDWWKWKVDPLTFDAVLLYAQRGHGRRASVYSDYTFALWSGGTLVPVAKAYSGLSDEEMNIVDRFVRSNSTERFGPVTAVKPELVCEIACDGVHRSTRHKSGIAVRFPRIKRLRSDKRALEADSLELLLDIAQLDTTGG